jgi:hypothetical protein
LKRQLYTYVHFLLLPHARISKETRPDSVNTCRRRIHLSYSAFLGSPSNPGRYARRQRNFSLAIPVRFSIDSALYIYVDVCMYARTHTVAEGVNKCSLQDSSNTFYFLEGKKEYKLFRFTWMLSLLFFFISWAPAVRPSVGPSPPPLRVIVSSFPDTLFQHSL